MLYLTIIAVGSVKESFWREAWAEYATRLKPYATLTLTEVAAEKLSKNSTVKAVRAREADRLRTAIAGTKARTVVALSEHGRTFTSPAFAAWLHGEEVHGSIAFVIGGARGLDESLQHEANLMLSLSPMTFLHEMARVILVEQLYRACTINAGKQYHYA